MAAIGVNEAILFHSQMGCGILRQIMRRQYHAKLAVTQNDTPSRSEQTRPLQHWAYDIEII
jgi:hypothetical protein